ncbi:BamA/TamA family outer membrane protein [Cellulophaga sp. HaHaR_3_176]|uniref:translocation and assembly module lipoprotein TamL n=1 Tax=Cellulophaga sp. HaHaR_3_176 TaxID=1942464 RepID=UPI001C1F3169|nr:BamA/TamA family outer membrane protein [Cellulophaga sp. HaHaR_3_176]QWX84263.1 BamA/TamA family outer membrane protein [Cellulophaga sp. HaHaR_3_176]
MKNNTVKIVLLFLAFIITSCNALKRVEDDELLLIGYTIKANEEKVKDANVKSFISQKPNSKLLGYPLRLNLYNLAKKDPDSSYQVWLHKKEKREKRLENLISKKQLDSLGESFVVKGYSEWLKKIGEAPVIIDTAITNKSLNRIKAYYGNRGYFNTTGGYQVDSSKRKKRATVTYNLNLGKPFIVDTTFRKIASPAIDSIYLLNKKDSYIDENTQFDLTNFNNERERLTDLFRNTGVYNFQESSIFYNIISDTTVTADDQKMEIQLNIDNLKKRGDTSKTEYKVYKFNEINIYADHLYANKPGELDSISYDGFKILYKRKLKYKPKALTDAIFLKKDSIYRDINRVRTYRQITSLNNFKYPTIEIIPDSSNATLKTNIYLSARDKYSFGFDADITRSNIQFAGLSFTPTLTVRNVFGGAENLSISGRANIGASSDPNITDTQFFNILEFGGDVTLDFPRIWMPFVDTKKIIPFYMLPQTRVTVGTSLQKNIGLDKQTFNAILGYNWTPKTEVKNQIELLNIQYVRNVNQDRFYNVYQNSYSRLDNIADDYETEPSLTSFYDDTDDTGRLRLTIPDGTTGFTNAILSGSVASTEDDFSQVRSLEERRDRLTQNNLIFTTNYSFSKSNKATLTDNSFHQFKFKLESAGNFLSAISEVINFEEDENQNKLILGVPYSQYVKTEFDYIKHWELSPSNVLAFRSFFGIAVPFGNSDNIPFARSYFAGGSYDNRAWSPYSLGPGRTDNENDFNEANLKIALNLEYRFPIAGNIKGALFADGGNIWNVYDNVEDPDATFNGISSLKDVALGTGFGVRYDFTYFVFRVDLGFKTYNPANEISKRWFRDFNFSDSVIQIGINYPF